MNKEKIKLILKEVLTDLEIKVYLASLEGSLTIQELAKKANLNRSGTYRIVENLINKGLLVKEIKSRGIKIIAEHPRKIAQLLGNQQRKLRRKELAFEELVPDILGEFDIGSGVKPKIKVFEGREGMERAYNIMLDECEDEEVLSFSGDLDYIFEVFDEDYWNKWNTKFAAKGNNGKMVVKNSASARIFRKDDKKYNRQTKIVEDFDLKTDIGIFKDKVLMVSVKEDVAILIESKIIADSYKILFKKLFNN